MPEPKPAPPSPATEPGHSREHVALRDPDAPPTAPPGPLPAVPAADGDPRPPAGRPPGGR